MKPADAVSNPILAGAKPRPGFQKAILRLVKGGPERMAIDAGQIDAIIDPASGQPILLPAAQRALIARRADSLSLIGLAFDWYFEQDSQYRFVWHTGATDQRSAFWVADIVGKSLWDLPFDNMTPDDWRTHRQVLDWRFAYRDKELCRVDPGGALRCLAVSGEPMFDDMDRFVGYRGVAREITETKNVDSVLQETVSYARVTLDALATPVGVLDRSGTLILTNRAWSVFAASRLRRGGAPGGAGENYLEACDQACGDERVDGITLAAGIRQVIAAERERFSYERAYDGPAGQCWIAHDISCVREDGHARAVVCLRDITDQKRAEKLLALEFTVARGLVESTNASAALQAVIRAVCEAKGWDCGRYFRLDAPSGLLRFEEGWGVPTAAVERFLEKSRTLAFPRHAGLAGRVCASGQPLWVINGTAYGSELATPLAPETGLDDAFVFPVSCDGRTIGVLSFSSPTMQVPGNRLLQVAHSIGEQLGQRLQRLAAADALRRSESDFRRLNAMASDWYWECDTDYRFVRFVGFSPFGAHQVLGNTIWELPGIVMDPARREQLQSQMDARWSFCEIEFTVNQSNGRPAYYSICGEPLYDDAGAFTGYLGTGLDITERKRTELEMLAALATLQAGPR